MSQKIVFMGTPEFSVPTLESLVNSNNQILAVYSQPPSKANRGQKITPSSVEAFANEHSLNPDIVVVIAYGKIIPKKFLDLPKHGFINVHASLLPKWRGAAPIQRAIMNLDNQTGISIMKIVEELDAGPVMQQDKIQINENIDTLTLSKVLSKLGANSILNAIIKIEKGEARFQEQNHSEATYAKKISKMEGQINWKESAKKVLAKINGLNPNPGAWFEYNKERYKVWKAKIVNENSESGKIVDNKLTISCKEQSIKILEIQKQGKSRQPIDQFLIGNKIKQGEKII
jgi:methionyl-tRNA formyltransferase